MSEAGDNISLEPIVSSYLPPYDRYRSDLEDFEFGGVALNDPTQGLEVQVWHLTWEDDDESPDYGKFTLTPEDTGDPVVMPFTVAEVVKVGLAFDQNMDPFVCWETKAGVVQYYWYDTAAQGMVTSTAPAGARSPACCLDDHRYLEEGNSDVRFGYILNGTCYQLKQRERYQVPRIVAENVGGADLHRVGLMRNLRLWWDIREGRGVRLSQIVGDLCVAVGLPTSKFDVSVLAPIIVRGFITAGLYSAADAIRSLQKTYLFDFPQIDGKLVAVLRGGAADITVNQSDCVAGVDLSFKTGREQGIEFPHKLHLVHSSAEQDYTAHPTTSERLSRDVRSESEIQIDSPCNLEPDLAAQIADKLHRVAWTEFEGKAHFALPESWARVVPSKPIMLEVRDGVYKRVRIVRREYSNGVYLFEAKRDRASGYTSTATGADTEPPTAPPPTIPGDTTWEYMDLPALTDDTLHYRVAGHGDAGTAWHGAKVQMEIGSDFENVGDIAGAALMGQVEEAVGTASADYTDTANTVLVSLNGTPEQLTTELLMIGRGLWLIGDELVQIRDWTAEGDNWRGSYLLRGRKNTTPAGHAIGTRAVFLEGSYKIETDVLYLNQTLTLRAPAYDSTPSDAPSSDHLFTGKSQREWAPYNLQATQSGSDWVLAWVPRWRLGNSANPVQSIHFLKWRLRITSGGTTVTKEVTDPAYTYLAADQSSDFGSALSTFDIEIVGVNNLTGEGEALSETV